jgi:hypothetical protein
MHNDVRSALLGLVIANFAAFLAVEETVGIHAAIVLALADGTVFLALAVVFVLLADDALVTFTHELDFSAKKGGRKGESQAAGWVSSAIFPRRTSGEPPFTMKASTDCITESGRVT